MHSVYTVLGNGVWTRLLSHSVRKARGVEPGNEATALFAS